ncbi:MULTISPECIES: nucleotidyltransferase family protein [unclassified Methylococcus]|uniref:nucleotidyltransferase family protein n=1 Tax=unclassified Methylococcus TaxID=2618889 RepID=UPI003D7F111D
MSDDFGLSAEALEIVRGILNTAGDRIERVAVFGSRAAGRYKPNSDLDLVLYGSADDAVCDRLWTLFQESSLPFSVDIKSYGDIQHPPLRAHIDQTARTLFVRKDADLTLFRPDTPAALQSLVANEHSADKRETGS